MPKEIRTIRSLAPEDVKPRTYVAEFTRTLQIVHGFCDPAAARPFIVRLEYLPYDAEPLEVVDVCVPYVLVKNPAGEHSTLDLRQVSLVSLPKQFGKRSMKKLRPKGDKDDG